MSFKRCEDLEDVLSKLCGYEGMVHEFSCSKSASPHDNTAWAVVELMDMVQVLVHEIQALKLEMSKQGDSK